MEAPNSGVLEMNYCPCIGCDGILVELEKFHGVQPIDRDAESDKVLIFITGDPYRVTKVLKKHGKKFEYFEYFEKSPPMNNQEMRLVIPPKPVQVVAQPADLEVDETIVKKTRVCCPKCNHEPRSGGRFGEILKRVIIFLGTIIGILLGDPTGVLIRELIEFVLNRLPKLLLCLLVCIACWVKIRQRERERERRTENMEREARPKGSKRLQEKIGRRSTKRPAKATL